MTVSDMLKKAEGRKVSKPRKAAGGNAAVVNEDLEQAMTMPSPAGGKRKAAARTVAELVDKEKDLTRTKQYLGIKRDLLEQLERNGTVGEQFKGLVDDYMKMWVIKEKLASDIKERGVLVTAVGPGGREYLKKNDSVDQLPKYNAQMLKLLSEIGIRPDQNPGEDDVL